MMLVMGIWLNQLLYRMTRISSLDNVGDSSDGDLVGPAATG